MGNVAFGALEDPSRLRVADRVGNEQYTLCLDSPVEPESVSTEGFPYPVSDAVRVEISGFELQGFVWMQLWNAEGELLHVVEHEDELQVPPGEYFLELCYPVKTYLRFSGGVSIESDKGGARIQFETPTRVDVGARSPRKQPAHSITTTREPTDIMQALSNLGEGLMTTTPSRSYPNLRGYPPEIRIGDELDVPAGLETGLQPVTIALPAELEYIYEAAPLVYYLNATVRPSSEPRVLVDGESVYELGPGSFADEVEELLRHVFVLDCVARSVGSYPVDTVECSQLADEVPYEFSAMYDADPGSRLRMYLDVPFEPVARVAPDPPTTVHVEPMADAVDAIPHVVAQLASIRTTTPDRLSGPEARRAALEAFTDKEAATRASSEVFDGDASFVDIGSDHSTTDGWVGDDVPISANKLVVEGFRNRFERTDSEQDSIDVTIVCNEEWMSQEVTAVEDHYGEHENLPFDVTIHEGLDRRSLAELLERETDFLHYVGHATTAGLQCRDGYLDVATASSIGVDTFLLNACQSYRQATKLVEGGAIGGIAALSDVTDDQAAVVGQTLARLLNLGFPLRIALEIARSRSVVGGQYLAVGDDSVTLVPSNSIPNESIVRSTDGGYELTIQTHSTYRAGLGGMFSPWAGPEDRRYLLGKPIGPFDLSTAELEEFLQLMNVPVDFGGEFRWAFDLAEELD